MLNSIDAMKKHISCHMLYIDRITRHAIKYISYAVEVESRHSFGTYLEGFGVDGKRNDLD